MRYMRSLPRASWGFWSYPPRIVLTVEKKIEVPDLSVQVTVSQLNVEVKIE